MKTSESISLLAVVVSLLWNYANWRRTGHLAKTGRKFDEFKLIVRSPILDALKTLDESTDKIDVIKSLKSSATERNGVLEEGISAARKLSITLNSVQMSSFQQVDWVALEGDFRDQHAEHCEGARKTAVKERNDSLAALADCQRKISQKLRAKLAVQADEFLRD